MDGALIATEFWDGIVAYISGCVGLITNDEAEKLYCATISPKAAWTLFATNEALSQQISPRTSRVGKQNMSCANRAVGMSRWIRVICRSGLIGYFPFLSLPPVVVFSCYLFLTLPTISSCNPMRPRRTAHRDESLVGSSCHPPFMRIYGACQATNLTLTSLAYRIIASSLRDRL
jgi:hypothetical protein